MDDLFVSRSRELALVVYCDRLRYLWAGSFLEKYLWFVWGSPYSEFNGPALERRLKRTVTIVRCNGMTVSDGDGTLASTIDSLKYAATLRIDFYNISVPVIVMRHGNCRTDTFYIWTNFGDYKMGSSFDVSLRPHYQFNPKSSRSSSTSSARGLLYEKYFRNH